MNERYDSEFIIGRFNRLMKDLIAGDYHRTSFEPWEVDLLLDMESCWTEAKGRRDLLLRYHKAVQRQLATRREMPMKLSQYLTGLTDRRASRATPRPRVPVSGMATAHS